MNDIHGSQNEITEAGMHVHFGAATDHPRRDPYLVKSVVHASQILSAFHHSTEVLPLKEIVQRCGLPKSMVFRLLYTMTTCHIVEKLENNRYKLAARQTANPPEPATPRKREVSAIQQAPAKDVRHIGLSSDRSVRGN